MDKDTFDRFIHFGSIGDMKSREQIATAIYSHLHKKSNSSIGFANAATDNFASSIDEVLENQTMRELCSKDPGLAEKITHEILDFINSTKKSIIKADNPTEGEENLMNELYNSDKNKFVDLWSKTGEFIQKNYNQEKIDINFYTEQFKSCFFEDDWQLKKSEGVKHEIDPELFLIDKFEKIVAQEKVFYPVWRESLNIITKNYKKRDIDCNEFFGKFQDALKLDKEKKREIFEKTKESFLSIWKKLREERILKEDRKNKVTENNNIKIREALEKSQNERFPAIKEHFIETWKNLIKEKQIKWELEIIEEKRKKFCEELYKRIEELKKLQEALEPFTNELGRLWDMSKGNWQHVNLDILKRYAEILQKDKSLKELAEMLGRMQQAEKEFEEELFSNIQLKTEWKVEHASKADLIGIHESDDLSSLLASETAQLADKTMQTVFFKKFAEKKLQTFEYQARMLSYSEEEFEDKRHKEKEDAKGPFIICVDTSGSMHGTPETVAKTICIAILKIAIRDNRKCYLISFSTGFETLNLTDLKNSLEKLISFLSMSFHGGTDATPAMQEALRMLTTQDYKKADVIMVSDFVMPAFDKKTQENLKAAKENKTKFHCLVIGDSKNPATIKDFNNNWYYDLNNQGSILTLVKNMKDL
jgi:uncharacterized protein with von Willebrand factor type A (vWA) domain